jgi:hypothetical protein
VYSLLFYSLLIIFEFRSPGLRVLFFRLFYFTRIENPFSLWIKAFQIVKAKLVRTFFKTTLGGISVPTMQTVSLPLRSTTSFFSAFILLVLTLCFAFSYFPILFVKSIIIVYAIDDKNVSHHDYHNRRQQRRHSLKSEDQPRKIHTSRISELEDDLAIGSTRSRIFHSSMKQELDQLLALNKPNAKNKTGTTDTATDTLGKLTQEIDHLKKKASTTLQQRRQSNPLKIMTNVKKVQRIDLYSPIQKSRKSLIKASGMQSLLSSSPPSPLLVVPLRIDKISVQADAIAQKRQQRQRSSSVSSPPPGTPPIVARLASPLNYTGLQKRAFQDNIDGRRNSSCTLSHADLRAERTARGKFAKGLRAEFYSLGEQ